MFFPSQGRSLLKLFSGETQDVMWRSAVEVTYDKRRYVQESVRVYALTMTALSFCTKIVY
jgi:hypothetical protein